jgi:DNA polymerase
MISEREQQLADIAKELESLQESPLYSYRIENGYKPVPGEGSVRAKIMFVGEAPGKTEALTGKPFCGRSGKMLDDMLASVGMNRSDVFITNIVKDRPQENRDPIPAEIELYGPLLEQQIDIIQPKIIVTLGRISMEYIMNAYSCGEHFAPISKIHGEMFSGAASYGTVKIATLYHPAVGLYNGGMRATLFEDFARVANSITKSKK